MEFNFKISLILELIFNSLFSFLVLPTKRSVEAHNIVTQSSKLNTGKQKLCGHLSIKDKI